VDEKTRVKAGAGVFMMYHLCELLSSKGLISSAEGASVMTETANDLRSFVDSGQATEAQMEACETVSRQLETKAAYLLGIRKQQSLSR
jgi:hypothetical protein